MSDRIRFHFDEHIDSDIAAALCRHGINVTTTVEAGLRTADDDHQFAFCITESRVIVTDDIDFLGLASGVVDHPGIVICNRQAHTTREIIRGLILIYEVLTPEEIRGRVEYI